MKSVKFIRTMQWRVPVGLQLSLLYALLFAGILSLLGAVLYAQLDRSMEQDSATRLQQAAAPLLQRVESPPAPNGAKSPAAAQDLKKTATDLVRGLTGPDVSVAVLDTQRQIIASSESLAQTNELAPLTLPSWLPAAIS